MLTAIPSPLTPSRPAGRRKSKPSSPVISRLLSAAVVNRNFRELLLSDPSLALAQGFQGESFFLSCQERDLILSIRASDLSDFANQIRSGLEDPIPVSSGTWAPVNQPALVMDAE